MNYEHHMHHSMLPEFTYQSEVPVNAVYSTQYCTGTEKSATCPVPLMSRDHVVCIGQGAL